MSKLLRQIATLVLCVDSAKLVTLSKNDICKNSHMGSDKIQFGKFMNTYDMMGHLYEEADAKVVPWIRDFKDLPEKEREQNLTTFLQAEQETAKLRRQEAEENKELLAKCDSSYFDLSLSGGYHMKVHVTKSKNAPKRGNIAIVDTMAGGGLYGEVWFEQVARCKNSVSLGNDIIYFTPAFRRPPQVRQPGSFEDVQTFIKHIYQNADKYGIDKTKIGVRGESGGGYIQSGLGMELAKHNDTYMVKSFCMVTPMLDDTVWTSKKEELNYVERFQLPVSKSAMSYHATDFEHQHDDPNLYPSKMSDALLKAFPRTVMFSTEYDYFRTESDKFAKRLRKAGRLDEYIVYPGSVHSFLGMEPSHIIKKDHEWNFRKWVQCYLRA